MIEIGKNYFSSISKLVNTDAYNNSVYYDYHPIKSATFADKDGRDKVIKSLKSDGFCVIQINNDDAFDTEKAENILHHFFGEPVHEKNPGNKSYATVQAEESGKYYINSHLAQPIHTDEGYTTQFPRYMALYCAQEAQSGGDSIIVSSDHLYTELTKKFGADVELLFEMDAVTVQNAYRIEKMPILLRLDHGIIGISYSPVLQKMWCKNKVFLLFDYITSYIHDPHNQRRFKLKSGQALLMDNCRMLHGRTAFPIHDTRLLYRYWFNDDIL